MALQKAIELPNGIVTNYHRIVSINKITNNNTIIEVGSYINESKRQEELGYYNSTEENKSMDVFIDTTYLSVAYDEDKTIKDYYEDLKLSEKFKDAIDA